MVKKALWVGSLIHVAFAGAASQELADLSKWYAYRAVTWDWLWARSPAALRARGPLSLPVLLGLSDIMVSGVQALQDLKSMKQKLCLHCNLQNHIAPPLLHSPASPPPGRRSISIMF